MARPAWLRAPHIPASTFAALLLSLVTSSATGAVVKAKDWPQFLGPTRDGVYAADDVGTTWAAAGPKVLWQTEVGHGFSGPVVAHGKAIVFHRVDNTATLDCLDADSGKRLWRAGYPTDYVDDFGFDSGPRATPSIEGDRVFTFGAEGRLTAWRLTDGKEIWSVDTRADFNAGKGFFGPVCSPLVEGEAVLLNVGGRDGAGVVAFDRASGKVLWKATDDEASYSSPTVATIGGTRYVLVYTRDGLVAIEPSSGKVAMEFPWRPRIEASVSAATPLVIGDQIFLSASYDTGAVLLKFAAPKPRVVWSSGESLSNHYATSVHHDGFLYGFHGRQEQSPSLRCVDLATGKVRWSEDDFGAGTVSLAGKHLLVLTEKGQLIAAPATPDGFKPSAKAQVLGFDTRAYPAIAGGRFYARGKDKLVCLDLRTKPAQ